MVSGQQVHVVAAFTLPQACAPVCPWHTQNSSSSVQVVDRSSAAHERHDFGDAGRLLYDFCWGEFADWYIEAAKARLYGQDPEAALQTRQVSHTLCQHPLPTPCAT